VQRHTELHGVTHDCREAMRDHVESALSKGALNGEGWAVCFFLKTQGKDRGYVEPTEYRHAADQESHVTDEDRQQQLEDLARRVRQRDGITALPANSCCSP
jgi:hypothetical protein